MILITVSVEVPASLVDTPPLVIKLLVKFHFLLTHAKLCVFEIER